MTWAPPTAPADLAPLRMPHPRPETFVARPTTERASPSRRRVSVDAQRERLRSRDPEADAEALAALTVSWWEIFESYEQQALWIAGSDRFFQLWVAARGTGKSWGGCNKCLLLALRNPGRVLPSGAVGYCDGAMLGRTVQEIDNKFEPMFLAQVQRFKAATGINLIRSYSAKHQRYTFVNGARMFKLSYGRSDALAKIRGYNLAWAWIDEIMFAEVDSSSAFTVLLAATGRHPLQSVPQLAVTTSPAGYRGVVAHFHQKTVEGDPEYYVQTATVFDNPYVDDAYRENLRRGCSPKQWAEEGLGRVLRPTNVVYADFKLRTHVIAWQWDPSLPWILLVDWGENWGWHGAAQVVDRANHPSGLLPGRWVVCREQLMRDGSRPEQRRLIKGFVADCGSAPYMAGADKAVPTENDWLTGFLGGHSQCGVHTIKKTDHALRSWGIGAISYMLNPGDGEQPRLFFASSLDQSLEDNAGTIVASMAGYKNRRIRLESGELHTTNDPEQNTPPTHSCDGTRYGISVSVWDPRLHGGGPLPYVIAHEQRADQDNDGRRRESRRPREGARRLF